MGQIPAAFWLEDEDSFRIICFRSVAQYAYDLLKTAAARDAARLIRINAHRDVAMRHLMPLVSALEAAALGEVVIVVTPSGP